MHTDGQDEMLVVLTPTTATADEGPIHWRAGKSTGARFPFLCAEAEDEKSAAWAAAFPATATSGLRPRPPPVWLREREAEEVASTRSALRRRAPPRATPTRPPRATPTIRGRRGFGVPERSHSTGSTSTGKRAAPVFLLPGLHGSARAAAAAAVKRKAGGGERNEVRVTGETGAKGFVLPKFA